MEKYPRVAIIYLSFHCQPYLDDVVSALEKLTYPKEKVEFVIVDNPHPQYGASVRYINEKIMPKSGGALPKITLIANQENLGFAGGNNAGIKYALAKDFDYVFLHNNDAFVAANFLEPLVEALEKDKTIGAGQSLLMLHPETELINSAGNVAHYLGFGYCDNYRQPIGEISLPAVKEIAYASGAAILMRVDLLRACGALDEDFFLYHEDWEYCYRLRTAGYKIVLARDSVVYHKYQFGRSITKYFWMERNRYGVLLEFFKWPTLVLIFPMLAVMELSLILFALKGGWFNERIKVYRYWADGKNWKTWLAKRERIQKTRQIGDRELTKEMVGVIDFQEKEMTSRVLKYVGNPLMEIYWRALRLIMFW
ncbi:MAG: glycosyltransferase family 2 protein [Candidatus Magasanikbacteria bacterium]|nr:glycosyltransferase family 2 protein [Candidatus Magasanikbacteria bacterium]